MSKVSDGVSSGELGQFGGFFKMQNVFQIDYWYDEFYWILVYSSLDPYRKVSKMVDRYGPVIRISFGQYLFWFPSIYLNRVIVGESKIIKKLLEWWHNTSSDWWQNWDNFCINRKSLFWRHMHFFNVKVGNNPAFKRVRMIVFFFEIKWKLNDNK